MGFDVVDVRAFSQQLEDRASRFVDGTFTSMEQRSASDGPERRVQHLAARFAAKEAFVKAWSGARAGRAPTLASIDLTEVEVVGDGFGRPLIQLHGAVLAAFGATLPNCRMHLSLSHEGGYAGAVVVLDGDAVAA